VTIGADIAVTSVIVERLKQKFPNAALTLVGGAKIREAFGGDPRLDFAELEYGRRATLMGRLSVWVELVSIVRDATTHLSPSEFLVVDPDSRLTQLGMLPVAPDSNYAFFPSREYKSSSPEPLAHLASEWSGQLLGLDEPQLPRLSIDPADTKLASTVIESVRNRQSTAVVSVNFGTGDNDRKRVGSDFEFAVLDFLLGNGVRVVLDKGAGPGEASKTDSLIAQLIQDHNLNVLEAGEDTLKSLGQAGKVNADLLVLNARVGLLAAMIASSDLYIGYDSAGQHIAAAAGTACIDIFAGYSSRRMIDRWRPTGPGAAILIDAGSGRAVAAITEEAKAAAIEALRVGRIKS